MSFKKYNIFNAASVRSNTSDKKSRLEPKYMKIGKYRKTKTLINNTLKQDFINGIHLIIPNNYLLFKVSISNMQKKLIFCMRVCRYKTASFKGHSL